MPAVTLLGQPLWGLLADKFSTKKRIYLGTTLMNSLILLLFSLPQINEFWQILAISASMAAFISPGVLDSCTLEFLGEPYKHKYGQIRMWTALSWGMGCVCMGKPIFSYCCRLFAYLRGHTIIVFFFFFLRYMCDNFGFTGNFAMFGAMMALQIVMVWLFIPEQKNSCGCGVDTGTECRTFD